ncbi:MAG: hypothetical protein KGI33_07310 [Thaumarchaeota archaeon]|nr:hypothetical protein [Nitrososphaerota archaeon]
MLDIRTDLVARVCIITGIFSMISYYLVQKDMAVPGRLMTSMPLLFVAFGVVTLISILYDLRRYKVTGSKQST